MRYLSIILILLISCSKKEDHNVEPKFEKIKYDITLNYKDSLVKRINPDDYYDYYAYIGIRGRDYITLLEKGDTLKKHKFETRLKDGSGFFTGCHPGWCTDYIVTIKNNYVHYILQENEVITFLGKIDNLEEALLVAKLKGYQIDMYKNTNSYRITDKGYEMRLMKFTEHPLQKEAVHIIVNKNGDIWAKSLGVIASGIDAYK